MPEYLAPRVYVEENSYRSMAIEGVSTSIAGFVGPTRFGPTRGVPKLLTSLADFVRIFGDLESLHLGEPDGPTANFLAHAVRAFFNEGGSLLHVVRAFLPNDPETDTGVASCAILAPDGAVTLQARFPGRQGNMRVTFRPQIGPDVLKRNDQNTVSPHDLVWVHEHHDANMRPDQLFWANQVSPSALDPSRHQLHVVHVDVAVSFPDPGGEFGPDQLWTGLSLHPRHSQALTTVFPAEPTSRSTELYVPLVVSLPENPSIELVRAVFQHGPCFLSGGNDGRRPTAREYAGDQGENHGGRKSGLCALEDISSVAIVAAPGSTWLGDDRTRRDDALQVTHLLLAHCEQMRYRVAILDAPDGATTDQVRSWRSHLNSSYGALYYPWLVAIDPASGTQIDLPPSGFVAGIWARVDNQFGVHKAPANEPVRSAIGLQTLVNRGQQDVLNPEGINCIRSFPGRGILLWGARTLSADSEWKYVNVRRYFSYLEHSLDQGTQWVVFESNEPALWSRVQIVITDFLFHEWKEGRLLGSKPEEAYFVRCDRSTMTQDDLDNGRLIVQVGVAPFRPTEFVVFRIGQWTASK